MGIIPRYSQTELGGMAVSLPKPWRLAAAAAALLILGDAAHAADVQVGIASAVVPSTVGSPRSAASRTLVLGADILFKERINTDRAGQAQIIFLDHSSLAIAPNSSLVIDEFVYDPDKSAGKLAVSASKGLLRYIGGKISKGSERHLHHAHCDDRHPRRHGPGENRALRPHHGNLSLRPTHDRHGSGC